MSIDATRWAWKQVIKPAAAKFVLLSMADRADENHRCYPSIKRLSDDTCLNRKQVMKAIEVLIENGLISAKKESGKVTIYTLIGVQNRHENGDKTSTQSGTGTSTQMGTSTQIGTSTQSGTQTSTRSGTRPVPDRGHEPIKNLPENLPELRSSRVRTCEEDSTGHPAELIAEFSKLGFRAGQIHTPKVVGMLRRWQANGVTQQHIRDLVAMIRTRAPDKTFSPAYLDAPMNDYIEAIRNDNAIQATGTTGPQHRGHRSNRSKAEMFWDNIRPGLSVPWDQPDP
jgi:DNA-binding transcriptional regulator YhcF (GntR family)